MSRETRFRFKQFEVENSISGMKVGTDSVLLGAWCSSPSGAAVIDVGAGCGLLSLMMAQRGAEKVTGVEIDSGAVTEAKANVSASPWPDKIDIIKADFLDLSCSRLPPADMIISNPPYFTTGALAPDKARATARHTLSLDIPALIARSVALLKKDGRIALVTPAECRDTVMTSATFNGLSPIRITEVRTKNDGPVTRILWELYRGHNHLCRQTLTVGSGEYIELVRPFYLNM